MLLSEVTTPLERHSVIEYAAMGNDTVRHWRELKQVTGSLYMSEPKPDQWGYASYDLYLIFPGIPAGAMYQHDLLRPDLSTVEDLAEEIKNEEVDTPEHFVAYLDRMMRENRFIGNVPIAFVRQWNPERAAVYAKYREEYYARKQENHLELERRREEQRKAEQTKRKAEERAARAEYLGWADSMTAMQFGRVSAIMERKFRFDGVVMSRKQFVISKIKDGWRPSKDENQTSWRRVHFEWVESKPHTEYRLVKDNLCYTISKTEYDFACHLVMQCLTAPLDAA